MSEFRRRLVHLSGTVVPLGYLAGPLTWAQVGWLLVAGSVVAAVLEALRLSGRVDWVIYDQLTREYEQDNPAGYALYAVSLTAVALAFRPPVAVPGMLMLTVADPISGVLGSTGPGEGKAPRVLATVFGVCLALALPFTLRAAGSTAVGVVAAAVGAAGATVADGTTPVVRGYVIDDNLSIPPVACAGIAAVLWLAA